VTLHANSTAGAIYKNKFESSETPTRTGTVTVSCSVCWSSDDLTRKVLRYWRNISSDGTSRSRMAADKLFNAHFQSFVVPYHKNQKCKTNTVLAEL